MGRYCRFLAFVLFALSSAKLLLAAVAIDSATVNGQITQITVRGSGFAPTGQAPTVTFNTSTLTVLSFNSTNIVASLPAGIRPGSYQITVKNSAGASFAFDLTVGATGAQGPAGPSGPQGPAGPSGPQGPTGPSGPQGSTGPQGQAGPQGPQGQQGLPGAAGPTGATGPQGPGIYARGPWASGGGYALNDLVSDQGQTYRCAYPQGAAASNTFNFYYSASGIYGTGSLATTPQGNNSYLVTSINGGQMNGSPLTLLPPNYLQNTQSDNIVSTTYPYFDSLGMEFSAGSSYGALFGLNGAAYFCTPGFGYCPPTEVPVLLTVIPVPQVCAQEPTASNLLPTGEWELYSASGAAGAQGPIGMTGAIGPQGPAGAQGAQGPAGAQGPMGTAGSQGPQGAQGPAGPAGQTGPQGPPVAFQGTWQQANSYNIGDAVSYNGSSYISLVAGNLANEPDISPTQWAVLAQQGAAGAAGSQGPQGLTGAMGPQGQQGSTGAQGPQGPAGPQGATGAPGPQGPTGPTGAQGPQGPPGPASTPPGHVALLQWWTTLTYTVGTEPEGVAFDGANIWVTSIAGGTVTKLVASTGALVGTYSVGSSPLGIAFDGTNIWVANQVSSGTVTKVLASTGAIVGTYSVGSYPQRLAFDGVNIWVTNLASGSVTKLVASTGALVGTYSAGSSPLGIAFDGTNIWVANLGSSVTEIQASSGNVLAQVGVNGAYAVCFDGTNIWVGGTSGYLSKVLASSATVVAAYNVTGYGVAFDGTNIWATNFSGNSVTKVSASNGAVLGTYNVGSEPIALAFDGGSIWVGNAGTNTVTRIPAF